MSLQVGDALLNGQVVIVSISDDLVTSIRFPNLRDEFNRERSVTFNPGLLQSDVEGVAQALIAVLG